MSFRLGRAYNPAQVRIGHGRRLLAGPTSKKASEGGSADMGQEYMVVLLLAVLCILQGMAYIEVRRLRKVTERK